MQSRRPDKAECAAGGAALILARYLIAVVDSSAVIPRTSAVGASDIYKPSLRRPKECYLVPVSILSEANHMAGRINAFGEGESTTRRAEIGHSSSRGPNERVQSGVISEI